MFYSKFYQYCCLVCLLVVAVILFCTGHIFSGGLMLVGMYVTNEVLWADHIRYDRQADYEYSFTEGQRVEALIEGDQVICPTLKSTENVTALLEVTCRTTLSGYLFDPYIALQVGNDKVRQYVERGLKGKRYLNISHLLSNDRPIQLEAKHCRITEKTVPLVVFNNPELEGKKILVLAPHPDDAEIAAFSLYRQYNSMIVTVTAGESEPDRAMIEETGSLEKAQMLKGRLRAWDSMAIPQWAGLTPDQLFQLGYPDGSLKGLQAGNPVQSENTSVFRQFNHHKLITDNALNLSWETLKQDFSEIIDAWQPEVIVTPHPTMDAHSDHQLTTKAVQEVVNDLALPDSVFLYYVNHLPETDQWPFGEKGTLVAPPPGKHTVGRYFSLPASERIQTDKACALAMMHDLQGPVSLKKQLRCWLQEKLSGRKRHAMGNDPYFRKAVRINELFVVENTRKQHP